MTILNRYLLMTLMLDHFNSLLKISINILKITQFTRLEILIEESRKHSRPRKKLFLDTHNNLLNKETRSSIDSFEKESEIQNKLA